jgi:lipopolysaccharide export LptBFGC system permease protein LptF
MDPLSDELRFLFYLLAVVCFALAAFADGGFLARRATGRLSLLPLGLALFAFPAMWDTGAAAF